MATNTYSFDPIGNTWENEETYIPEGGVSLNNRLYTFKDGRLWRHNSERSGNRNNFYNTANPTEIVFIANIEPSTVKHFNAINFEGTENWTINGFNMSSGETATVLPLRNKENKQYGTIIQEKTNYVMDDGTGHPDEIQRDGFTLVPSGTRMSNGAKGYFAEITMRNSIYTSKQELFSVETDYVKSS